MNAPTKPAKKATILDLDALFDTKMDEIETLPDYVTPPPGLYVLRVKDCGVEMYSTKEDPGTDIPRIKITYEILSTEQINNGELPVPDLSIFTETFQATDDGKKFFKKAAMNILGETNFGEATFKDVMEGVKDAEFRARVTTRLSKPDATGHRYENTQVRAAAPVVDQDAA